MTEKMNVYMKGKGQVDTFTLINSAHRPKKNRFGKGQNAGVQLRKSRFMADSQIDQFRSDDPNQILRHSSFKSSEFRSPDRSAGGDAPIEIKLSKGDLSSSSESGSPPSLQDVERHQERALREARFGQDSPRVAYQNHPSKKYFDETPMICEENGKPKFVSFRSSLNSFFSKANSLKNIKIRTLRNILPFGSKEALEDDEAPAPKKHTPSFEHFELETFGGLKKPPSQPISSSSLSNRNRTFKQLQLNLFPEASSPPDHPAEPRSDAALPLASERFGLLSSDPRLPTEESPVAPEARVARPETPVAPEPQKREELVEPTVPKPQESPRRPVKNLELPISKRLGGFGLKLEEADAEDPKSPQQQSHFDLEAEYLEPSKQQRRSPRSNSKLSPTKRRNGLDLNLIPALQLRKIKSLKEAPQLQTKKSMVDLNYQYEENSGESCADSEEEDRYKADIEAKTAELQANPKVVEYFHKKNTIRYSANANLGLLLLAADLLVAQLHLLSNARLDASPRLLGTTFIIVAMLYLVLTQASLRNVRLFKAAVVLCVLARLVLDLAALHRIKSAPSTSPL